MDSCPISNCFPRNRGHQSVAFLSPGDRPFLFFRLGIQISPSPTHWQAGIRMPKMPVSGMASKRRQPSPKKEHQNNREDLKVLGHYFPKRFLFLVSQCEVTQPDTVTRHGNGKNTPHGYCLCTRVTVFSPLLLFCHIETNSLVMGTL